MSNLTSKARSYFRFNEQECPSFLKVQSVGISALPSLEVGLTRVSGKYGVFESGTTFGEKVISLDVVLVDKSNNIFQMASELAQFLKGDNWKLSKLTFQEIEGKHMMAKVKNSVGINDLMVAGSGTIEFVVPTPLYVSDTETVFSSDSKSFTVVNNGTHEVQPLVIMNIKSAVGFVEIKNSTTNKTFRVDHNFSAGNVLEVDFSKKVIKVGESVNLSIFNIESDWLELVSGNNSIIVNTSATTEVKFNELFI